VFFRPIFALLTIALSSFLLISCGGGGGGGSAPSSPPPAFPQIPPASLSDIASIQTVVMDRTNSRVMVDALLFLTGMGDSLFHDVRNSNYSDPTNTDKVESTSYDCASGTPAQAGQVSNIVVETVKLNTDGTGRIVEDYKSCVYGGYKRTGYQDLVISSASNGMPGNFLLTYSQYRLQDSATDLTISGTLESQVNGNAAIVIENLQVTDTASNAYVQARNFRAEIDLQNVYYTYIPAVRSGTVVESNTGKATLSNTVSEQQKMSLSGVQSSVTVDLFRGTNSLTLLLDVDGDGQTDAYAYDVPIEQLTNDDGVNQPPAVQIQTAYTLVRGYPQILAVNGVSDPDYDFLSFNWSILSTPAGAAPQLDASNFFNPVFTPDKPGDYVVRLTIVDNGGPNYSDIHVHVTPRSPAINPISTITTNSFGGVAQTVVPLLAIDGPYQYVVISGPSGLGVDSNGNVTWTPGHNPLFSETIYDSVVRVSNSDHFIDVPIPIRVIDRSRTEPIARTDTRFETTNSKDLVAIGKFFNGGGKELLVHYGRLLYTLQWNGTDYVQHWVLPYNETLGNMAIAAADLDGDGQLEIIEFFSADGLVVVLKDGKEIRRTLISNSSFSGDVGAVAAADIDNDGHVEIVVGARAPIPDQAQLAVKIVTLDATTLSEKWRTAVLPTGLTGINSLVVANVDTDPELEIVSGSGYVIDGGSHQIQWYFPDGFGDEVFAGDFNGDGVFEIAGLISMAGLQTFDAVTQSKRFNFAGYYCQAAAHDVDGDGSDELLLRDCLSTQLTAEKFFGAVATPLWQMPVPNSLIYGSFVIGDLDADNLSDIAVSSWRGDGWLEVRALGLSTLKWSSYNNPRFNEYLGGFNYQSSPGIYRPLFWGKQVDMQGDVSPYQLWAGTMSYEAGRFSPLSSSSNIGAFPNYSDLQIADYDHDGYDELFLGRLAGSQYAVNIVDPLTGVLKRSFQTTSLISGSGKIGVGDVNGDGAPDVVVAGTQSVELYDPTHNLALQAIDASSMWSVLDIQIADLDGDGINEILILDYATGLKIFHINQGTYQLTDSFAAPYCYAMLIADINNDGIPEIILSTPSIGETSAILTLNNHAALVSQVYIPGVVQNLSLNLFDGAGQLLASSHVRPSLLAPTTSLEMVDYVMSFDPYSGAINWRSVPLVGEIAPRSMRYGHPSVGGDQRLTIGTQNAMYMIQK